MPRSSSAHVLIVDDEPDIRASFEEYLERAGYRVTCAESSEQARRAVACNEIDLALLDVAMPGEDGLSLARFLREHTSLDIIIVASAGDVMDRVVGIEVGADDYLPKPVDLRELGARVLAVLRRKLGNSVETPLPRADGEHSRVHFGACRLDLNSHELFESSGKAIPISDMDFRVLKVFADHPGRVLSRERIFELTRDSAWASAGRSVDIQIGRLRRKIEADPKKPRVIKTIHSAGYVFSPFGD